VARLATTNPSGGVDLVPITFALVGDDTLVTAVDHKPKATTRLARLRNVASHPAVTVLVDHYDDDWASLWWVRMRGQARVVEPNRPGHGDVVAALVARYQQYADRPPEGPALVISVTEWRWWAATG
jgi:PPOX class probable F420-dependent enzyme